MATKIFLCKYLMLVGEGDNWVKTWSIYINQCFRIENSLQIEKRFYVLVPYYGQRGHGHMPHNLNFNINNNSLMSSWKAHKQLVRTLEWNVLGRNKLMEATENAFLWKKLGKKLECEWKGTFDKTGNGLGRNRGRKLRSEWILLQFAINRFLSSFLLGFFPFPYEFLLIPFLRSAFKNLMYAHYACLVYYKLRQKMN